MNRFIILLLLTLLLLTAVVSGGCAYFNTFYNAKQKFTEAERDTERNQRQAATRPAQGTAQQPAAVPVDKYRKVIETCAKLLELYPKSRWVDDALFLMGVSYYRLNDLARADRKFTELMTLFPKSPDFPAAVIWRARTLADMKQPQQAIAMLSENLSKIKAGPQRAQALYRLAHLQRDVGQWSEAVDEFKACLREKQPRSERIAALHELGMAEYHVGDYAAARTVFSEVAAASRDLDQAFDAYVYWSRCEARLGNTGNAESILMRARSQERFVDFMDQTDLELAELTLREGRIDDAIALYEHFVASHDNGEARGLAFYRLANIYREQRVNLTMSKALLDSATHSGAAAEIADSARAALVQISKGILALETVTTLSDQLRELMEGAREGSPHSAQPQSGSVVAPESREIPPAGSANDSTGGPPPRSTQVPTDTNRSLSPAEIAADSIVNALRRQGTEKKPDSIASSTPAQPLSEIIDPLLLRRLRRDLQAAYLHIAEFYEFDLADHDSASYYYRLAAADTVNSQVYWKANLFLAMRLAGSTDTLSPEEEQRYRAVLNADSVPIEAANLARAALHLPLLEVPVPPQLSALRAAEAAQFADSVSLDSVLQLYSAVIAMDSTSADGRTALFAKAAIFEDTLRQPDSARAIYRALLQTCTDSSTVAMLRAKLAPPDSSSPFLQTNEQLFGQSTESVEAILQPAQTEPGWPPPEESLRGRRFR
jgi:tetratricopeptide (TPR) repeat protein